MTTTATITCDCCGDSRSAAHHSGLMDRLRRAGWSKGPCIEGVTTHFCSKDRCREALQNLIQSNKFYKKVKGAAYESSTIAHSR